MTDVTEEIAEAAAMRRQADPDGPEREREEAVFERIEAFRRRKPRLLDEVVTSAHGAGGKASAALLDQVFLPAFADDRKALQTDAAVITLPSGERLAFSTDSFVVKPWRFPGGTIGDLAVNGTVNDLAMMGARPIALSAGLRHRGGLRHRLAARDRGRHGRGRPQGRGFDRHR